MGLELSKPECNINPRFFIGVEKSEEIFSMCAMHKIYWALGLLVIFSLALVVGYYITKDNDSNTALVIPLWLVFVPFLFFLMYASSLKKNMNRTFHRESLEQKLSGMDKKDYLNYKAGDDRANKGFLGSATSASILASSNILGPYFRSDR